MTLTEQMKKGKLELGKYYIKTIYGGVVEDTYIRTKVGRVWNNYQDDEIIEVLAPVPSYEELQELSNKYDSLQERLFAQAPIHLENQQLKELLNYIRDEIADMPVYAKQQGFGWISEAAYRIDKAIGEK